MTRTTWARVAGSMFLLYIVIGIAQMGLFGEATNAHGSVAKLARIAEHAATVRFTVLLSLLTFLDAVVLSVALFALTREQDHDLAILALCFRVCEGMIAAVAAIRTLGILDVAIASTTAGPDAASAIALGASLLKQGNSGTTVAAICFALGSTVYCYLFLQARSVPVGLSWLGVFASVLLVIALPLQLTGLLGGTMTTYVWMPMLFFEVPFALWLLIKGVANPKTIAPPANLESR
jgi:hypothetical protein